VRGGQPTVRGMRISVYDVVQLLASGVSHADIVEEFPELTEADIMACLAYVSAREQVSVRTFYETTARPKSFA
jgi:uncharacterized protein (DUF433 family)